MKHFLLIISLLIGVNAFSQSAFVRAELDTNKILIGDQVHLTLTVEQQASAKVFFPILKDTVGKIVIVETDTIADTIKNTSDYIRVVRKYTITSFDSGDYSIAGLPFLILNENTADTIFSNSIYLSVRNAEAPKGQEPIFDIKSVLKVPYTFLEILTWGGIVLLVVLLIGLIMYIVIKHKQNAPLFKIEKPLEPPHIIAFRELDETKAAKLWQQGLTKQYYSRLSEIIKAYFERRYNMLAIESTTDEVLDYFKGKDNTALKDIEKLLRLADLVKFAKAEPMPNENEDAWSLAYNIVMLTKTDIVNDVTETPENSNL